MFAYISFAYINCLLPDGEVPPQGENCCSQNICPCCIKLHKKEQNSTIGKDCMGDSGWSARFFLGLSQCIFTVCLAAAEESISLTPTTPVYNCLITLVFLSFPQTVQLQWRTSSSARIPVSHSENTYTDSELWLLIFSQRRWHRTSFQQVRSSIRNASRRWQLFFRMRTYNIRPLATILAKVQNMSSSLHLR